MKTKYTKFILGLLFFVAIFSVLFSKKAPSKESFKSYNITFNKIDGVQVGTDVLISGVKVGFVNKVSIEKESPDCPVSCKTSKLKLGPAI